MRLDFCWVVVHDVHLSPKAAFGLPVEALVSIAEQIGNVEGFGAAGQAVAAVGAAIGFFAWKPMSGVFKHAIAVLPILGHVIGNSKVAQPQHFGNIDGFWAGQTGIALTTAIAAQGVLLLLFQSF
jgi:hypothetical protein